MRDGPRKEKLSIYLAREGFQDYGFLLKQEMVEVAHHIPVNCEEAIVFIKKEPPSKTPAWAHLLTEHPGAPEMKFGKSASVGAVLLIKLELRVFLISFGSGFHLIHPESMERDFGLRVTLNAVEPDKLRSLDKASYDDSPLSSRTQSTTQSDIFDLQANSESDLVYAVTGACRFPILGSHITGRDALTLMVETDIPGILPILTKALQLFREPLPSAYSWIDNVARVRDPDTLNLLDLLLDDLIKRDGEGNLWMGEPEIVDWESNAGYSFDMRPNTPRHQVLQISDLREYIESKGIELCLSTIKSSTVHINNSEYNSIRSWSAYRCLYAEISEGDDRFTLRNGAWFRIESDFIKRIDDSLTKIPVITNSLPIYSFANEGEYNQHASNLVDDLHLMDKNNIQLGGPLDKIEFCDLIEGSENFIHVKYYRSSATLSHLFAQGLTAAEAFVKDEAFRQRLNKKLPQNIALKDAKSRPNASNYTITYAIATNKSIPSELPFFSKVSLKNAASQLLALGYQVKLTAIPIDPQLPLIKKQKPKKQPL